MSARRALRTGGLWFDGVDDYVETGLVGYQGASPKNGWTIMCWVKIGSGGALYIGNRGEEGLGYYSLTLFIHRFTLFGVPAYNAQFGLDRDGVWRGVYFSKDLRDSWHHLAGVFRSELYSPSAPEKAMEVWVDGVRSTTPTPSQIGSGIPFDTWSREKYLINYHQAWATFGRGIVSEIRIYNRALTEDEIRAIYERGALIRDGLVLHLDFTEYEGNVAYDKSGCGNHATIYGARWVVKKPLRVLPKAR
ncbi:MAG: LamG-like jellyroll fold domain-containing protein [Thermofilum sp.]|uniref:LamG-like jellyroll fold domain-containing protein n=1 Tax=Thermofilum sp. TaxID=1961369 RepID=UPI00315EF36D